MGQLNCIFTIMLYFLLAIGIGVVGGNHMLIKNAFFYNFDSISPQMRRDHSSLKYKETFEEGEPFINQSKQFALSHSFNVVAAPDSRDNKVGRFELKDTDPQVKRSIRTEVGFRTVQKEAWYAYSIYYPHKGYEKDNTPEIISQWHQSKGGSPPNAVQIENDDIYFRTINRSDTRDNSNKVYTNYPMGKVKRGEWQEYIFHFIHSPDDDGLIEMWLNGEKTHTLTGPNMRNGFELPYFKFGIYKWRWNNGEKTQTDQRVLFFDNVRIGDRNTTLNDIAAICK